MRVTKTWAYDEQKGPLTEQDVAYLRAAQIEVQINNSEPQFLEYAGQYFRYQGEPRSIKFITVDQTTESMLLLRFSDKLFLIAVINEN